MLKFKLIPDLYENVLTLIKYKITIWWLVRQRLQREVEKKNSFSKHSQTQLMQKAKDLIKSLISAFTCKNNERN